MSDDDVTTREMIVETRRDVAWIRETLGDLKRANVSQGARITDLETANNQRLGRDGAIAAAISAVVAFFTALASGGWFR